MESLLEELRRGALTTCDLSGLRIGPQEATTVATALEAASSVTALDLSCNPLGAQGARIIADVVHHKTTLRRLDLHGTQLGAAGAAAIASVISAPYASLQQLVLDCNNLGDAGAQVLATALRSNQRLTALSLAANGIETEGVQSLLESLPHHLALRYLDLSENEVPDYLLLQLQQALNSHTPTSGGERASASASEELHREALGACCERLSRRYRRLIQDLTAQLHHCQATHDEAAARQRSSRATSPLPLHCPALSHWPHDSHGLWDPAAISEWEPGLLFPGPPSSIDSLPLNFSMPADWSTPATLPASLDWDPLFLFTPNPTKGSSIANPHDACIPASPRLEANNGAPKAPSAVRTVGDSPKQVANGAAASLEAEVADAGRPKEPTRISNLRRRLHRIQIIKQKLKEGSDPPPDHRQIAALEFEEAVAREIAEYEQFGTWSLVGTPKQRPQPKAPKVDRAQGQQTTL